MRPRKYYVVWDMGRVIAIAHGAVEAKRLSPSYRGFKTRTDAEEYAAWWNRESDERDAARRERISTKERTVSIPHHQNAP